MAASTRSAQAADARVSHVTQAAAEQKALASQLQQQLTAEATGHKALLADLQQQLSSKLASSGQDHQQSIENLQQQLEQGREEQAVLVSELQTSQTSFEQLRQSVEHERAGMAHEVTLRKQLRQSARLMRNIQAQQPGSPSIVRLVPLVSSSFVEERSTFCRS